MSDPAAVVDDVVRSRTTAKVEVEGAAPVEGGLSRAVIEDVLATAGFAPFHHAAAGVASGEAVEPWRCHVLDAAACRWLRQRALAAGVGGRVPRLLGALDLTVRENLLLGAASALAVVTWMPEGPSEPGPRVRFEGTLANMEHVAAVGGMVQTALVAATARGIPTYWSSGGWIGTAEGLATLGIPSGEILLAAVFFAPPALDGAEVSPGKHRDRRSPLGAWARWVEPPEGG